MSRPLYGPRWKTYSDPIANRFDGLSLLGANSVQPIFPVSSEIVIFENGPCPSLSCSTSGSPAASTAIRKISVRVLLKKSRQLGNRKGPQRRSVRALRRHTTVDPCGLLDLPP